MAKKEKDVNKELFMIILVSIVAISGLFMISQYQNNASGLAINQNIECIEETVCLEWDWESRTTPICEEFEVIDYKACTKYSEETGELECIEWTIMPETKCLEWRSESDWKKKCINEQTIKNCKTKE
jgi:hypothetical protein